MNAPHLFPFPTLRHEKILEQGAKVIFSLFQAVVQALVDAGAVPFSRTNIPQVQRAFLS